MGCLQQRGFQEDFGLKNQKKQLPSTEMGKVLSRGGLDRRWLGHVEFEMLLRPTNGGGYKRLRTWMGSVRELGGAGDKNLRVLDIRIGFKLVDGMRSPRGANIAREKKRTRLNAGPPTRRGQGEEVGSAKETVKEQPNR